ncbi:hypothetical protein B0H11DRAFT_1914994 [Mycena galericulata]|nr:hypothetical protein B0H11DRAFT_1914994 [Mycena galericulata]
MNHQDRVVIHIPEITRFATTEHRGSSSSANIAIDGDTTPSLAAMSEDPDPRHGQEGAEIGRESSMPFSGQEGRHASFDQTLRLDQRLADVEKQLGIECKDRSNFEQRLLAAKNKLTRNQSVSSAGPIKQLGQVKQGLEQAQAEIRALKAKLEGGKCLCPCGEYQNIVIVRGAAMSPVTFLRTAPHYDNLWVGCMYTHEDTNLEIARSLNSGMV